MPIGTATPYPYTVTHRERRRAPLSSFAPAVSDFPQPPRRRRPSPLPDSPSSDSTLFVYSGSSTPSFHRVAPSTYSTLGSGFGIDFGDPDLQRAVRALEQLDDPVPGLSRHDHDDDCDDHDDDRGSCVLVKVRRLLALRSQLTWWKRFSRRGRSRTDSEQ